MRCLQENLFPRVGSPSPCGDGAQGQLSLLQRPKLCDLEAGPPRNEGQFQM